MFHRRRNRRRARFREASSLLKNSIQARSWLHRPALEAPNRALEPRNRRFSTRIEDQTQATESFSTGESRKLN